MKKSGTRTPRVEIQEIGPSIDFIVRRTSLASDDLYKEACKQPKAAKVIYIMSKMRMPAGTREVSRGKSTKYTQILPCVYTIVAVLKDSCKIGAKIAIKGVIETNKAFLRIACNIFLGNY